MRTIQRDGVPNSVLGRSVSILACFEPHDGEIRLSEISRRTGIPKATVHRLVGELAALGLLERTEDGVRLGMRLFEFGQLVPHLRLLRDAAQPVLRAVYEATHQTVHLAVLDGHEALYVDKIAARSSPGVPSRTGGRMPLYCTGVGKVLLAHGSPELLHTVVRSGLVRRAPKTILMPRTLEREVFAARRLGFAVEQEESTKGALCSAAPVFSADGRLLAALSLTGSVGQADINRMTTAVRSAARSLSRRLEMVTSPKFATAGIHSPERPDR